MITGDLQELALISGVESIESLRIWRKNLNSENMITNLYEFEVK